jgi:hypothetical protein
VAIQADKTTQSGANIQMYYRSGADLMTLSCKEIVGTTRKVAVNFRAPNTGTFNVAYLEYPIKAVGSSYLVTTADSTILCTTAGGSFTVTLPTGVAMMGRIFIVKIVTISATNTVTVVGATGSVDGAPSKVISSTALNSFTFQFDGVNYWII